MRAAAKELRTVLCSAERDEGIFRSFAGSPFWSGESFFVYRSVRSEASTEKIIASLRAAGKRVCVPRVSGGVMTAVREEGETELAFGIPQPVSGEDEPCAVALVPLLAFDSDGYRLGYGGGYYDRYFAAHPNVLRIGLAYEGQAVERLPRDGFDVPLHAVVTERGVRIF